MRYQFRGAYIWRVLYTEGLIFGILRYVLSLIIHFIDIACVYLLVTHEQAWEGGRGKKRLVFKTARKKIYQNFPASKYDINAT